MTKEIPTILPNLHVLREEDADDSVPYTFFLKCSAGNVLLATKADIGSYLETLESHGGVQSILLGDRHHASKLTLQVADHFKVPLTSSDIEAKALKASGINVGNMLPFVKQSFREDICIIPVPGHTRGAFAYIWSSEAGKVLFIGDTLVPVKDEWQFWVTKPNRIKMLKTMQMLKEQEFDYIVSNSFGVVGEPCRRLGKGEKNLILNTVIAALSGS